MKSSVQKQSFIQGASILMGSMLVVKIIGAVFKIPIANILTPVGMAYFNTSYQMFTTVYALTVTGFSAAVARMVAAAAAKEEYRQCRKILKLSQFIFVSLGLVGGAIMLFGAGAFSELVNMPNARYAMMAMAPAILFSCMMAAYRGYYEGLRNMTPTAVSQIIEVLIKLAAGLLLAYAVIEYAVREYQNTAVVFGVPAGSQEDAVSIALPFAAAGAIIGIAISTFAAYLYVWLRFKFRRDGFTRRELKASPRPQASRSILSKLVLTALPITLSAVALNLTNIIDVVTISNRLKDIYSANPSYFDGLYGTFQTGNQEMHEIIYGAYTYALPYFSIVSAFTTLFGKSALPHVTEAWVQGDKSGMKNNIESVLRMTALVAFPAGIGLSVLSKEIITLFHGNIPEAVAITAPSLQVLGIAAIFLAFTTPIYAIFQGMGHLYLPLIFVLIGGIMKIGINYYLIGIEEINIRGAAYGSLVCYAVIFILSLIALNRVTKARLSYLAIFLKPLFAALLCGGAAYLCTMVLSDTLGTIAAIGCAGVVYIVCILLFRAIPKSEIMMLPKGEKLVPFLQKLHLLA